MINTNKNIHDIIVARIHEDFIKLLPEEELRDLVTASIERFKKPKLVKGDYNRPDSYKPSELDEVIHTAMRELLIPSIQKHLHEALAVQIDNDGKLVVSEALDEIVKKNAANILNAFMVNAIKTIVELSTYDLRTKLNNLESNFIYR